MAANDLLLILKPQQRLSPGESPGGFHGLLCALTSAPWDVHERSESLPVSPSNSCPQDSLEVVPCDIVRQVVQCRSCLCPLLIQKRLHFEEGLGHAFGRTYLDSPSASLLCSCSSSNPLQLEERLQHDDLSPRPVPKFHGRKERVWTSARGPPNAYAPVAIKISGQLGPRFVWRSHLPRFHSQL